MFPDPCGMDVEWATLLAIAVTKTIEVWFLFSLPTGNTSQQRYKAQQARGDHSHSWHRCVGEGALFRLGPGGHVRSEPLTFEESSAM
jgi:hypothetical protein